MKKIDISKDFSRHPAGRYLDDGPYNGELFRIKFLEQPMRDHEPVVVSLDGARGYGSSFLEEAFGGLARRGFSVEDITQNLTLKSANPVLIRQIMTYIKNGLNNKEAIAKNARRTHHAR